MKKLIALSLCVCAVAFAVAPTFAGAAPGKNQVHTNNGNGIVNGNGHY